MPENPKPRLAMYWASACGGCEIAVLNTYEKILEIGEHFEIVFWPIVMDSKYVDVHAMPDESIDICLFNGSIRNSENEEMARLMRSKSKNLIAFGSCASEGCIPGLANLYPVQSMLETAYTTDTTENPEKIIPQPVYEMPEGEICLPRLEPYVRTLDQVVPVDYYVPGCPPESSQISSVVETLIRVFQGNEALPGLGSVLGAGGSTVCDECLRKRGEKAISEFKRMATFQPAAEECLLDQGILCSGVATRSGCEARCPGANMPCIGCYGPPEGVLDQGARFMSAIASVINASDSESIVKILNGIEDPAGTFYRFGLPHSLLKHAKIDQS